MGRILKESEVIKTLKRCDLSYMQQRGVQESIRDELSRMTEILSEVKLMELIEHAEKTVNDFKSLSNEDDSVQKSLSYWEGKRDTYKQFYSMLFE